METLPMIIEAKDLQRDQKFVRVDEVDPDKAGQVLVAWRVLPGQMFSARGYLPGGGVRVFPSYSKVVLLKL